MMPIYNRSSMRTNPGPAECEAFELRDVSVNTGGAELCFWTDLVLTTQECEPPPQPTQWTGRMENFFSEATSPDTIGNGGLAAAGYEAPPGFDNTANGAVGYNSMVYAKTRSDFESTYGSFESNFAPAFANLRIVKIDPATATTIEITPIPGSFTGEYRGQSTGFREQSYWANFSGVLPALEPGFWYGFIADLACTPNADAPPGTSAFTVEISGPYSFDVRTLVIPGAQQDECSFAGPTFDPEAGGYVGYTWVYNKFDQPCGGAESVDGVYDGDPVVIPTTFTCT